MRTPSPLWGYPSQDPIQQLDRAVDDLWELWDDQHAYWEDMSEIIRAIQQGVGALKER